MGFFTPLCRVIQRPESDPVSEEANQMTQKYLIPALSLCVLGLILSTEQMVGSQSLSEAPAGFDSLTNGFTSQATFNRGRVLFERRFLTAEGLGPTYNTQSCAECHANPVTGGSSQVADLLSGKFDGTNFIDHPGDSLINDRAIDVSIQETVIDGNDVRSLRTSLNTLGAGFVEGIADETLLAISNNQPESMRGLVIMVPVLEADGALRAGRFGSKDQHASLLSFAADEYLNKIGITSGLRPTENTSNGVSVSRFDTVADPELSMKDLRATATFIRSTKAPPRNEQLAKSPDALAGAQLFTSIGCAVCHVPTITTAPAGAVINGGAFIVPPELGNKIIRPFSDFLLHDIGTGDGIVQNGGQPTRNTVRTIPLWGLRARDRLMHDGNARTFNDAILAHAGQATEVTNNFQALSSDQKRQLLTFLRSL
jgi:CxxC motif-containing protein (DUF1111 family)